MERPSIGPFMVYAMELPSGLKYILLLRLLLHEEAYKRSVGRVVNDVNVLGITILVIPLGTFTKKKINSFQPRNFSQKSNFFVFVF